VSYIDHPSWSCLDFLARHDALVLCVLLVCLGGRRQGLVLVALHLSNAPAPPRRFDRVPHLTSAHENPWVLRAGASYLHLGVGGDEGVGLGQVDQGPGEQRVG
jgi:hypothetical protein